MPDALSKTIPIWCSVLNYLALGGDVMFFTPPNTVSASEHDQIRSRVIGWAELAVNNGIDVEMLKTKITKPLRPLWITPDAYLPDEVPEFDEFYPLILCTASRMVQDGTEHRQGYTYVQGAADDHEEWAQLLTPELLWFNRDSLGDSKHTDSELHEMIENLAEQSSRLGAGQNKDTSEITLIKPTNISIASRSGCDVEDFVKFDLIIDLSEKSMSADDDNRKSGYRKLTYPLAAGKKGSKELRTILPDLVAVVSNESLFKGKILVICDTGTDFSVGVALVIVCLFYSLSYDCLDSRTTAFLDKTEIRKRLVHIISEHKCNPSRNTLNAVNAYLMG
ncbi:Rit1p [Sugiyamaella lignohabitans]|uniref:Rit1p n=1 Tax=Sugiyamaella lignohabitans TaxID=796027 RepID=A0A167CN66_9ASCO|nr:Rit1p [Sugiyamaella lignohabitans]ANB11912.1 Rit1p [Sugiyamaella lignohabitans]